MMKYPVLLVSNNMKLLNAERLHLLCPLEVPPDVLKSKLLVYGKLLSSLCLEEDGLCAIVPFRMDMDIKRLPKSTDFLMH